MINDNQNQNEEENDCFSWCFSSYRKKNKKPVSVVGKSLENQKTIVPHIMNNWNSNKLFPIQSINTVVKTPNGIPYHKNQNNISFSQFQHQKNQNTVKKVTIVLNYSEQEEQENQIQTDIEIQQIISQEIRCRQSQLHSNIIQQVQQSQIIRPSTIKAELQLSSQLQDISKIPAANSQPIKKKIIKLYKATNLRSTKHS